MRYRFIAGFAVVVLLLFIFFIGTEEIHNEIKPNTQIPTTTTKCYSKEKVQKIERARCNLLLQQIRYIVEAECDCSEIEESYQQQIQDLENTCYYWFGNYFTFFNE